MTPLPALGSDVEVTARCVTEAAQVIGDFFSSRDREIGVAEIRRQIYKNVRGRTAYQMDVDRSVLRLKQQLQTGDYEAIKTQWDLVFEDAVSSYRTAKMISTVLELGKAPRDLKERLRSGRGIDPKEDTSTFVELSEEDRAPLLARQTAELTRFGRNFLAQRDARDAIETAARDSKCRASPGCYQAVVSALLYLGREHGRARPDRYSAWKAIEGNAEKTPNDYLDWLVNEDSYPLRDRMGRDFYDSDEFAQARLIHYTYELAAQKADRLLKIATHPLVVKALNGLGDQLSGFQIAGKSLPVNLLPLMKEIRDISSLRYEFQGIMEISRSKAPLPEKYRRYVELADNNQRSREALDIEFARNPWQQENREELKNYAKDHDPDRFARMEENDKKARVLGAFSPDTNLTTSTIAWVIASGIGAAGFGLRAYLISGQPPQQNDDEKKGKGEDSVKARLLRETESLYDRTIQYLAHKFPWLPLPGKE
jgi:hypothetical protein